MNQNDIAGLWDRQYQNGKYLDERHLDFVEKILSKLQKLDPSNKRGLYVGCGNGRNYIPLANAGLDLIGIDVSPIAIKQLIKNHPKFSEKLYAKDFIDFQYSELFGYVISIQTFQHGNKLKILEYFDRVSKILTKNGMLFLRVNSISTDIYFKHTLTEKNADGGITVRYDEGPKKNLQIHFFAENELKNYLAERGFKLLSEPEEKIMERSPPKKGKWTQWEIIAKYE